MATKKVKVTRWDCVCLRCSHTWMTYTEKLPVVCGNCKSKDWNKPKVKK